MSDVILSSIEMHDVTAEEGRGLAQVVRFNPAGEPHARALVDAVVDRMQRLNDLEETSMEERLRRLATPADSPSAAGKVTILTAGHTMLGAPVVCVDEGRLFLRDDRLAFLPKNKRTNGVYLNADTVLAVLEGWCHPDAHTLVAGIVATLPKLRPLTRERLLQLPPEGQSGDLCTLAVFGTHPLFAAPGCLWLCCEYWPTDDILDRDVLLIHPQRGVSEHGSVFGQELLRMPVGEVVDFKPIPWAQALELCNLPFDAAIATALGTTHHRELAA